MTRIALTTPEPAERYRYWRCGPATLHVGDALTVLAALPDDSVGTVVTVSMSDRFLLDARTYFSAKAGSGHCEQAERDPRARRWQTGGESRYRPAPAVPITSQMARNRRKTGRRGSGEQLHDQQLRADVRSDACSRPTPVAVDVYPGESHLSAVRPMVVGPR